MSNQRSTICKSCPGVTIDGDGDGEPLTSDANVDESVSHSERPDALNR